MSETSQGFQFDFPLYFIAHKGGRIPTFRDMLRRRWFFLFTTEEHAKLWLARCQEGSVVLTVNALAPVCEFVKKNRGAGFVFNPTPVGTAAGVLPLERALAQYTVTLAEDDNDAHMVGLELDIEPLN
jgi:hypothetical protein